MGHRDFKVLSGAQRIVFCLYFFVRDDDGKIFDCHFRIECLDDLLLLITVQDRLLILAFLDLLAQIRSVDEITSPLLPHQ